MTSDRTFDREWRAKAYFYVGSFMHIGVWISFLWALTADDLTRYVIFTGLLAAANLLVLKSFQIIITERLDGPGFFDHLI